MDLVRWMKSNDEAQTHAPDYSCTHRQFTVKQRENTFELTTH